MISKEKEDLIKSKNLLKKEMIEIVKMKESFKKENGNWKKNNDILNKGIEDSKKTIYLLTNENDN